MGHCVSRREGKKPGEFNWKEIHHLERMFEDLSSRSRNDTITKEIFKCFFNLNGLWGEEIFRKFDRNNQGELGFFEFCEGLDMLVKGNYQRQIYYLFQFYDTSKQDGIRYDELLKMFHSYSVKELLNLVDDDGFLETMKEPERKYLFGKKESLDPLREVVEESSSSEEEETVDTKKVWPLRRMTSNGNSIRKFTSQEHIQEKVEDAIERPRESKHTVLRNKQNRLQSNTLPEFPSSDQLTAPKRSKQLPAISTRRRQTLCDFHPKKHQIKTIPTISLLAKKYATYLFKQFKLDKEKDSLTYKQFLELVTKHEKLFLSYFGGFHQYIWQMAESEAPEYIRMTSWIQGPCSVYDLKKQISSKRYLKFYKTTLFVLRSKDDTVPEFIVNLEGLLVSKYERGKEAGFLIQHRDGLYPQRAYLFPTLSIQQQWAHHFRSYMNNSIHEQYNILDQVGSGNYSTVFKAQNKQTKSQVAIKVIQKFKFSAIEKQIIKEQCGFLQLALHPSIVSFIQQVETKTHLYLITEYMGDGDLLEYVKRRQFLDEYEAAIVMDQLFSALEYLNSLSIIHRDLKCENIMVRVNQSKQEIERVKIIDFGFAVYKDVLEKLPQKERYVGTPNYVAPQILKNQVFNEKVDMFSLGVIMYYILSGYLPFDSLFNEEITQSTVNCTFELEGRCWDSVSSDAKDLIQKMLCTQEKRISIHQALKHPWLKRKEELKSATKRDKGLKYI